MAGCHTNTATAPLSACHEALVKTLPIQADLSWSRLPLAPFCAAAFSFFSSSYYILLPFCLFCLNRHLVLLGPETHSLRANLSLCPSSNRILSLSITLDIRVFLLILPGPAAVFKAAFSSSATWQSLWTQHEAYSSLTAHLMLLYRHHAFQRTDCLLPSSLSLFSPALAFACLLHLRTFLLPWIRTGVAVRLFSSTCTKPPNLSTCPSFLTTAPAPIMINIPIQLRQVHHLPTERKEGLTLPPRLQVFWLCLSFAVLVVLTMLVIYTQFLPFLQCAWFPLWWTWSALVLGPTIAFVKNLTAARDSPPSVQLHACGKALCSSHSCQVLPRRSFQSNDSSRILIYPLFGCDGMSWSKNHVMPISTESSCSGRSRGSPAASDLEGASHCIRRFTCARPLVLIAFSRWSGPVFNRLHCVLLRVRIFDPELINLECLNEVIQRMNESIH